MLLTSSNLVRGLENKQPCARGVPLGTSVRSDMPLGSLCVCVPLGTQVLLDRKRSPLGLTRKEKWTSLDPSVARTSPLVCENSFTFPKFDLSAYQQPCALTLGNLVPGLHLWSTSRWRSRPKTQRDIVVRGRATDVWQMEETGESQRVQPEYPIRYSDHHWRCREKTLTIEYGNHQHMIVETKKSTLELLKTLPNEKVFVVHGRVRTTLFRALEEGITMEPSRNIIEFQ